MLPLRLRPCALVALVAVVCFIAPGTVLAGDKDHSTPNFKKLDNALQSSVNSGKGDKQRVIVRAKRGYEGGVRALFAARGNQITSEQPSIGGMTLELDAKEIAAYSNVDAIEGLSIDADISASADKNTNYRGRGRSAAPAAANTLLATLGLSVSDSAGAGVTVALIDSGLQPMPAFAHRIKAFYDFTDGKLQLRRTSFDDYGHGTHVAGLIGGLQTTREKSVQGVAPGVDFVVLKVLDNNGRGRTSDVIRAIEFAVATASDRYLGIDIINLSLGHPIYEPAATDPLVQAVERASRAGVIVVASAGNFGVNPDTGEIGYAGTTSPGNAPSAITVGAFDHKATVTRDDDRVAPYSSRGPTWYDGLAKPDIVAPGHFLMSEAASLGSLYAAHPTLLRSGPTGKRFLVLSGTSMAAGVTTGVVARLHETATTTGYRLTPNLAKAVLQFTAIPLKNDDGVAYDVLTQGTGGINPAGALEMAASFDVSIMDADTPWTAMPRCSVAGACTTIIGGEPYAWARNVVWGENVVWGDSVFFNLPIWSLNVVWGDNVVWGENVVWGDGIVWGANVVWGDAMVWGNNIVWGDNVVWGENVVWGNELKTLPASREQQ